MIKHDHVWEKWTPDLASKLKLSIDFRSENGSDEFWVRWHTMLWFSTCPSPFPIGVYDTDKHYTTNQSWAQLHYEIGLEFSLIIFSFNSMKSYGSTFTSNFKIVYHRHAQPYAIVKYVKINPFLNGWPAEQLKADLIFLNNGSPWNIEHYCQLIRWYGEHFSSELIFW